MFTPFLWVGAVLQEAEKEREERSSSTVTPHKLCFVWRDVFLRSQETLILETDFLWQLIWAKARLKALSAAPACTLKKNEEGIEGGGSFETHLPHLTGWGVFPSILFLFLTTTYFLSLLLCSPNCCPSLLKFHCWVLFGFSNVNTQEPAGAEELSRPQRCSQGPCGALVGWNSQGPNINTACDAPSQHAFKPSSRGS